MKEMFLEVLTNPVTGETMRVLESTNEVFKIQYDLESGGAVPAVHFHPHQTQIISVVSGELYCQAGDRIVVLRAGESAEIPPYTIHTQWNPTKITAVAIEELRPALQTHALFRVLFALAKDGYTDSKGLLKPVVGAGFLSVFDKEGTPASLWLRFLFGALKPISRMLGHERMIHEYIRKLS